MGLLCVVVWASAAAAQSTPLHYRNSGDMPPGAIGRAQLQRGGPLPGFFQPIEILAPAGALVAMAQQGTFEPTAPTPRRAGILIGQVYRLKVTQISGNPGIEVFPTIELIDRIYPPRGMETEFPIPIQITKQDLLLAAEGKMVTRVIYLEDPHQALPVAQQGNEQHWFDVGRGDDPLRAADALGRPVAILRMGGLVPDSSGPDQRFLFGSPPYVPLGSFEEVHHSAPLPYQPPAAGQLPAPGQLPANEVAPSERFPR